jgi:hypothetical protein
MELRDAASRLKNVFRAGRSTFPALIETPLQAPRGSAPPLQKNDFAVHDFVEPSWRGFLIKRSELSVKS